MWMIHIFSVEKANEMEWSIQMENLSLWKVDECHVSTEWHDRSLKYVQLREFVWHEFDGEVQSSFNSRIHSIA